MHRSLDDQLGTAKSQRAKLGNSNQDLQLDRDRLSGEAHRLRAQVQQLEMSINSLRQDVQQVSFCMCKDMQSAVSRMDVAFVCSQDSPQIVAAAAIVLTVIVHAGDS